MPLVVRGLASQDAAAFTALVERSIAAGELLGSSAPHGEHLVEFSLAEPQLVGVAEDDGALVGWVHPEIKALVVEPDHRRRGIGRALVDLGLRMEAGRGRPNLILGALPGEEPAHSFVGATGFELHSLLWDLELPPEARLATPEWPAGVATRPVRFADDRLAFIRLFNAAFADHATPLQMDEGSADDPPRDLPWTEDDLLVAEQGGELIGFAATEPVRRPDGGVEPRAEIWTIGVRPDRQGAGLGRQLLRWGVGHLRELGARDVVLSVNGRNPRALGLYESEGFVRTSTRERWARPVSGAG
jgi:mycothiol synthase